MKSIKKIILLSAIAAASVGCSQTEHEYESIVVDDGLILIEGTIERMSFNAEYSSQTQKIKKSVKTLRNGVFSKQDGTCLLSEDEIVDIKKLPVEEVFLDMITVESKVRTIPCPEYAVEHLASEDAPRLWLQ